MDHIQAPAASGTRQAFVYDGRISELYGVFLLNLLLTIITLGIFRFWAITRLRRYLWSHLQFEGTRLSYTGKGKEMFLGFMVAMVVTAIFSRVASEAMVAGGIARTLMLVLAYPILLTLLGAARFAAQRYRLSRTEWRGIRGGMEGSPIRYGLIWTAYMAGVVLSLWQAIPWMQTGLARRRINASRFGSAVFACEALGRRLYPVWLATWVGSLLLLGAFIYIAIYGNAPELKILLSNQTASGRAGELAADLLPKIVLALVVFSAWFALLATWYFASLTRLIIGGTRVTIPGAAAIQLSSSVSPASLFWLFFFNGLIGLFTLGLGLPIVLHRSVGYFARTTLMTGTFDAHALLQSTEAKPALGEGFLQALDPGVI